MLTLSNIDDIIQFNINSLIHKFIFLCYLPKLNDMKFTLPPKHHALQQPLVHIEVKNVEAEKFEVGLGGWLFL